MQVPHPFMHMDRILKQGREYVEDVINHVRTCLWPDPAKHPNNVPREPLPPSQPQQQQDTAPTIPPSLQQSVSNGSVDMEDELMNDVT
jgi:hypothetical protein